MTKEQILELLKDKEIQEALVELLWELDRRRSVVFDLNDTKDSVLAE